MEMPRPTEQDKDRFRALVPDDADVQVKPMFGNLGAFVGGALFMGLFGSAIYQLGTEKHHDAWMRDVIELDLPGAFAAKTVKGHKYWYFQYTEPAGIRRQVFVGTAHIKVFQRVLHRADDAGLGIGNRAVEVKKKVLLHK